MPGVRHDSGPQILPRFRKDSKDQAVHANHNRRFPALINVPGAKQHRRAGKRASGEIHRGHSYLCASCPFGQAIFVRVVGDDGFAQQSFSTNTPAIAAGQTRPMLVEV